MSMSEIALIAVGCSLASIAGIYGLWRALRTGKLVLANGGLLGLRIEVSSAKAPTDFWSLVAAAGFGLLVLIFITLGMAYLIWTR